MTSSLRLSLIASICEGWIQKVFFPLPELKLCHLIYFLNFIYSIQVEREGGVDEIEDKGGEAKPIIPYVQQGNLVFTGVGKEREDEEVGGLDSDDEMEINLLRHR